MSFASCELSFPPHRSIAGPHMPHSLWPLLVFLTLVWHGPFTPSARGDDPPAAGNTSPAKSEEAENGAKARDKGQSQPGESKPGKTGEDGKPAAEKPGADQPKAETKEGEAKEGEAKPADGKADGKEKEGEKKEKPRNPLTDLLIRNFRPAKGAKPNPTVPTEPVPDKPGAKKHSKDPTAPYDQKGAGYLIKAKGLVQAGDWPAALELLQKISELPEDSLFDSEGTWSSLRGAADELRGQAPAELLEQYRTQYSGLAQQLLTEALATGRPAGLGRVARGYFHTPAGYEAANRLGSYHLERGEYAAAARWFTALWKAKPGLTDDSQWRLKSAFALRAAGLDEPAQTLLASAGTKGVDLAGTRQEPTAWWQGRTTPIGLDAGPQRDWPQFYGNAAHAGRQKGGTPLLYFRWQQRLTQSETAHDQLTNLIEDLTDAQIPTIPVMNPVLIDGLLAVRTLYGVQVIEAVSGRLLWSSLERQPIDSLLRGNTEQVEHNQFFGGGAFIRGMMPGGGNFGYSPGAGENTPLAHLVFRNANFGLVSSDGSRLFVLEDNQFLTQLQPGQHWGWNGMPQQMFEVSTQLTAYDLRTGRPLWEVGGPAQGEDLDPPLAGYFLFGPPVVDRGEMFVLGEATSGDRTGQIRLLCLDPASGVELWSQLVAYADTAIGKDVGRRWFTAQPAIDNGQILCPTTVGWLVAVDRTTHSVTWGYRPARPQQPQMTGPDGSALGQMVTQYSLGGVWQPTPPIAAGGRVLHAPIDPQQGFLYCLDQSTGKELWNKPRGNGLYVAGVFDGLVVVVGREMTVAYRLTDGEQVWTASHALPSGRGVASENRYHLPLAGGEIVTLDLAKGAIVSQTYLPDSATGGVGNLVLADGLLVSVDPFAITAYEDRETITGEIARRKATNPEDPLALLREAEMALLQRSHEPAVELLRRIPAGSLPEAYEARRRGLLFSSLQTLVRADFHRPSIDADMRQLQELAESPEQVLALRRLQADRHLADQQFELAFDAYLKLADDSGRQMIPQDHHPAVQVRADWWVAGKLVDLLANLTPEQKPALEARVAELVRRALEGSPEDRRRFLDRFPDQPQSHEVRLKYADDLAADKHLGRAEFHLQRVARRGSPELGVRAVERLARLLEEFGLREDARVVAQSLGTRYRDTTLADGRTGAQVSESLLKEWSLEGAPARGVVWPEAGLRTERMAANYQNYTTMELGGLGPRTPLFGRYRLNVDPQSQRLEMVEGASDRGFWTLPLRSGTGGNEGGMAFARGQGHRMLLLFQGVLHALSPYEKQTLWTRPLEARSAQQYYGRAQTPFLPLRTIPTGNNRQPLQVQTSAGPLSLMGEEVIGVLGRRYLQVLDAETGEVRWQMRVPRNGLGLTGGDRVVYLGGLDLQAQAMTQLGMRSSIPMSGMVRNAPAGGPQALRTLDGRPVEVPKLRELQQKSLHALGDDLLLATTSEKEVELRRYNPLAEQDVWKTQVRKGALVTLLDDERLAYVEPAGKDVKTATLGVLDLADGSRQTLDVSEIDIKAKNELFVFTDREQIYLVVNRPGSIQNYYNEQLPYVRINGTVAAFELATGQPRWKQQVLGQNLLLERLEFSPVLLFVSRKFENKGQMNFWSMHLVALDKATGVRKLDEKSAQQPGFRSLTINARDRFIELRGWNDRLRLYPTERAAAVTPPTPEAKPVETKPGEAKPEDKKPADAADAKPADAKPAIKPAEDKPAENHSAEESTPQGKTGEPPATDNTVGDPPSKPGE
ncbi:MAG: PQQ-binding-like beta-propeller repeat protein [Planctomycetaceae bacterium]